MNCGTTSHPRTHLDDVRSDVTVSHRNLFSSSISEMITTFSMSAYKVGLKVNPNEQDQRVPVLIWSTCAYTIQSIGIHTPERYVHTHICVSIPVGTLDVSLGS